jgi:hypothetical protein
MRQASGTGRVRDDGGWLTSFQLLGFRLSLCFTSRCAAQMLPSGTDADPAGLSAGCAGMPGLWCSDMYTLSFSVSVPSGGSHREMVCSALK